MRAILEKDRTGSPRVSTAIPHNWPLFRNDDTKKSRAGARDATTAAANYTTSARDEFSRRNRSRSETVARTREKGGKAGRGKVQQRERERTPRAFPRTEVEGHPNYPAIGFDGMR